MKTYIIEGHTSHFRKDAKASWPSRSQNRNRILYYCHASARDGSEVLQSLIISLYYTQSYTKNTVRETANLPAQVGARFRRASRLVPLYRDSINLKGTVGNSAATKKWMRLNE